MLVNDAPALGRTKGVLGQSFQFVYVSEQKAKKGFGTAKDG